MKIISILKSIFGCLLLSGITLDAQSATVITQWTFNADNDSSTSTGTTTPFVGAGTASLIGGVTSTFAAGSGNDTDTGSLGSPVHGNSGWNTTNYATQSTESGQRGVQFLINTSLYEDIVFSFDHRASGTASRWAQVDYTLDGGSNWTTGFWNNNGGLSPNDTYYTFSVDFSSVSGADNNPLFGVRIVSIFSPLAFDQNASLADFAADSAYMRASADASYTPGGGIGTGNYGTTGTWRFDMVTFSGNAIPEPSRALLVGLGALGLLFRRRRA